LPGGRCGLISTASGASEGGEGGLLLFRAAKFRLDEIDEALVEAARRPGYELVGRVGLTDSNGWPRCATVRAPDLTWSLRPAHR
jgi:hypothetical protein